MKKVAFVTGSRADYGILRRYLFLLNQDSDIKLEILVTGALLDETYGRQVELVYKDGFSVAKEVQLDLNPESNCTVIHSMSQVLDKFGEYFEENKFDLLIILGDRYEILSIAIAASMQRIPLLHIHGGELTYGNYDEFIRHAITKMSLFHFASTEEYRLRVIQLGEDPSRVFYLGALGAENCLYIEEKNVPEEIIQLPKKKYFVVLFHTETLTGVDNLAQINELLSAVLGFPNYYFVFLGTNADTGSNYIRNAIHDFVVSHSNTIFHENLHSDAYHYLLRHSICLVGNSSSGIIEAPSLGIFTVNIGNRQDGRVKGSSVIDTPCISNAIFHAIKQVLCLLKNNMKIENPYYKENSAVLYYETTKNILKDIKDITLHPKKFYDYKNK